MKFLCIADQQLGVASVTLESQEYGGAKVVTLPWVSPKHLVAASNGASRENVYEAASEMLIGIARDLRREAGYGAKPVILLLHWSVSGSSLPTGLPVDQLHDVILPWPDLDALDFDAVVCGHIHKAQAIWPKDTHLLFESESEMSYGNALGFYCGSPQPLNHGEGGVPHGVWIVNTDGIDARSRFLPIESPRFVTHDLDLVTDEGIFGLAAIQPVPEGAILRIRYKATREGDAQVDKDLIRRELIAAGASRVTIEPNIIREARARAEHLTETLTELDALAAYCDAQNVGPGMRDRMIERTGEWL